MPGITVSPLSSGVIDEIFAQDAQVRLRQDDPHHITLEITQGKDSREFRFRSQHPARNPGIAIRDMGDPPPGHITAAADHPETLTAYELPQGSVHVEILNPGCYWIGLDYDIGGGFFHIMSGNKRSHLALTAVGPDEIT